MAEGRKKREEVSTCIVLTHGDQFIRTYKIEHGRRTVSFTKTIKFAAEFPLYQKAKEVQGLLPGNCGALLVRFFDDNTFRTEPVPAGWP